MNADGGIELRFGGATLERHGEALNDFSGFLTHHMHAQYPLAIACHDQLHEGFFFTAR